MQTSIAAPVPEVQKIDQNINELNDLSINLYLLILDFKAIRCYRQGIQYEIHGHCPSRTIFVNPVTNRYLDSCTIQEGTLVDLACLIFGCTPDELCGNIIPYWIDELMAACERTETYQSAA